MTGLTRRTFTAAGALALLIRPAWGQRRRSAASTEPASVPLSELAGIVEREVDATRDFFGDGVTNNYTALAEKFHLEERRKSVAHVLVTAKDGRRVIGSAVLLDDKGRLGICFHEDFSFDDDMKVSFNLPNRVVVETKATVRLREEEHDVAIAEIDPDFIKKNQLVPVKRSTGTYKVESGKDVVCLGFHDSKLHAVARKLTVLMNKITDVIGYKFFRCKIETAGEIATWGGMSGGSFFDEAGTFIGGLSLKSYDNTKRQNTTYFTPAGVFWKVLDFLDTGKASALLSTEAPVACQVHPRQLKVRRGQTRAP